MVALIEEIDPEYYKDFIYINIRGNKCMYEEPKEDIYGTLEASLLFCKNIPKSQNTWFIR